MECTQLYTLRLLGRRIAILGYEGENKAARGAFKFQGEIYRSALAQCLKLDIFIVPATECNEFIMRPRLADLTILDKVSAIQIISHHEIR